MDAVAAAALAAIVDHDCARVLQDLIAENAALRQQLEQQRQQFEQQRQEIDHQWQLLEQHHLQIRQNGLRATQLSIVLDFAAHDMRTGDITAARERLYDYANS